MLVETFLSNLLPSNSQNHTTQSQGEGFQAVMERADASETRARTNKTERQQSAKPVRNEHTGNVQKSDRAANNKAEQGEKSEEAPKTEKSAEESSKTEKKSDEENTQKAEKTQNTEKTQKATKKSEVKNEEVQSAEIELKAQLASILGIPLEDITRILETLGLQPADLINPEDMNRFMQAVFEVNSPVELLSVPNIPQIFTEVKEAIAEFAEIFQPLAEELPMEPQLVEDQSEYAAETKPVEEVRRAESEPVQQAMETVIQEDMEVVVNEPIKPLTETILAPEISAADAPEPEEVTETAEVEEGASPVIDNDIMPDANQALGQEAGGELFNNSEQRGMDQPQTTPINVRDTVQFAQSLARTQQAGRSANPQDVINQIVGRMRAEVRAGVSEVRVTLRPEQLGDVTLRIVSQNGAITAQFSAENERVKDIIEANFDRLKEILAERGLDVANLEVEVGQQDQGQHRMEEFLKAQQRTTRRIREIITNISEEEAPEQNLSESNVDYMA